MVVVSHWFATTATRIAAGALIHLASRLPACVSPILLFLLLLTAFPHLLIAALILLFTNLHAASPFLRLTIGPFPTCLSLLCLLFILVHISLLVRVSLLFGVFLLIIHTPHLIVHTNFSSGFLH